MSLEIESCATAQELREAQVEGRVVVAIDTLRAATTAAVALENGASAVWPVRAVAEAFRRRERMPDAVLGGERNLVPVDGFDAGNSPYDYRAQVVAGRPLVLTTTNGTLALSRSRKARGVAFGALRTSHLAARWLRESGAERCLIALSGTGGKFSFEDAVTAGAIASHLPEAALDDLARTCLAAFRGAQGALAAEFGKTPHGRRLISAGFGEDVALAALLDAGSVLPVRDEAQKGRLVAWRGA